MLKSSKFTMMVVVASLGVATLSTTMVVAVSGVNYQKLFRNTQNSWIITKSDLENEENTFTKSTIYGNLIEFEKSDNLVKNVTPLTGLEAVTLQSTNSYLQVSTGFNEDSFLYERYFKNDGSNEFTCRILNSIITGGFKLSVIDINQHKDNHIS